MRLRPLDPQASEDNEWQYLTTSLSNGSGIISAKPKVQEILFVENYCNMNGNMCSALRWTTPPILEEQL
jgi:hypothetical protein